MNDDFQFQQFWGPDIVFFRPQKFQDERGYFEESFNLKRLSKKFSFKAIEQVSRSVSKRNTFRGMHWQTGMNKIMHVVSGRATMFAINILPNSEKKVEILPNMTEGYLYAPWWYARGFLVHEDNTEIQYFQDMSFNSDESFGVNYVSFPAIIDCIDRNVGTERLVISEKDLIAPLFKHHL